LVAALTGLLVTACSNTPFNLPSVGGPDDSGRLPGKVIWHDLITDTPEKTQQFYSALFGWEFEPLPDGVNYVLIRHHGRLLGGMVDQTRLPSTEDISQWVVALSVADIEQQTEFVRAAGGTVFTPPTSLGDRGRIAVVADDRGALLALLQTPVNDPADRSEMPATGEFLWDELWTDAVDESSRFYLGLAPLSEEKNRLEGPAGELDYRVLAAHGKPRFGIRPRPDAELPPMWASYLRVADEVELSALLARVESLGGKVLMPSTSRPEGGSVAVIVGPSGAGIALQTWPAQGPLNLLGDRE
jgi:predicted enzyme related to lactoylglutathione lyase